MIFLDRIYANAENCSVPVDNGKRSPECKSSFRSFPSCSLSFHWNGLVEVQNLREGHLGIVDGAGQSLWRKVSVFQQLYSVAYHCSTKLRCVRLWHGHHPMKTKRSLSGAYHVGKANRIWLGGCAVQPCYTCESWTSRVRARNWPSYTSNAH